MTEAMSRREIEDVLTSIKRLVSQEAQGRVARPDLHGKLVLTSELRVDPVCDEADAAEADEAVVAPRLRAAGGSAMPVFHEPAPHIAPQPAPSACETAPPVGQTSLLRRISQGRPQPAPAPAPAPDPEPAAELPPAPTPTPPSAAPEPAPSRLHFIPADAPASPEPSAAPVAQGHEGDTEDADLEATLARLEAVLAGKALPEDRLATEETTAAPHPQTHPEPQPAADSTAPQAPPAQDAGFDGNEILLDEDMLFRLVSDIVRLELQGELGEKITRNIRKLVRAEVARELQLRRNEGMNV